MTQDEVIKSFDCNGPNNFQSLHLKSPGMLCEGMSLSFGLAVGRADRVQPEQSMPSPSADGLGADDTLSRVESVTTWRT